jgi:hypothetical protein
LPFDKLKAPSKAEGLSLPAGRQGLILSGAFARVAEAGVCLQPEPFDRLKALSSIEGLRPRARRRSIKVTGFTLSPLYLQAQRPKSPDFHPNLPITNCNLL